MGRFRDDVFYGGSLKAQIREQMCLETNFQYKFSFLGRFGQSGLQRKKIQTAISTLLLRPVHLCFHGGFFFLKQ